ncbi:MAG: sugar phosphate isomerase/epimerase [Deltaproteobacteria bacterium]|nr:sugar phosphate isomerase/epimerase [Deltaproteobacteria bacterium]
MIGAAGYGAVEILADQPHLYAPEVTPVELENLCRRLAAAGLRVANINANTAAGYYGRAFWEPLFEPSLANPAPAARRWRLHYTRRCIDFAVALGAPSVSITAGRMVPGTPPAAGLELLQASLRELLPYAADRGIRLGVEYEPGLLVENCRELLALLAAVDSPWLGANLDLGHSQVLGEDPAAVIAALGKRIVHLHLEDIRQRKHYHLIPGTGEMDFGRIFQALQQVGYAGFLTVELYTYPREPNRAARQSLAYLRAVADNLSRSGEVSCSG